VAAAVLFVAAGTGAFVLWRRRSPADPPEPPESPPAPPPGPPSAITVEPLDEGASQTVVVRRSMAFGAIPQQKQVLTAQEPSIKYCTACGMRLGHGHRFCGYCGHPSET
jgi:hypothetical protein